MTQRDGQGDGPQADTAASGGDLPVNARGEVLISGLDTGPLTQERENVSPTDQLARFQPAHPNREPTDEDG